MSHFLLQDISDGDDDDDVDDEDDDDDVVLMMMPLNRLTGHKDAVTCVSLKGSTLVSGSR